LQILNFWAQECNFCKKILKMRENIFIKQVLDFVELPIYMKYNQNLKQSQKSLEPTHE
jgi:hypothetical protein